jgi:hypothetical protein
MALDAEAVVDCAPHGQTPMFGEAAHPAQSDQAAFFDNDLSSMRSGMVGPVMFSWAGATGPMS